MLRLPNCPRWDHNIGLFSLSTNFGDKFVEHAIQVSRRPLAFTHSNALPLCDNCGDKSDGQISALTKGGVLPTSKKQKPPTH